MSRVKPVSGAMAPKGARSPSALIKFCLLSMGVMAVIFFMSTSGTQNDSKVLDDNLRSGQAMGQHSASAISPAPADQGGKEWFEGETKYTKEMEQDQLKETINYEKDDIKQTEEEEVEKYEEGLLGKALESMEGVVEESVTKLLGDDAGEKQVEEIAQEIEDALRTDADVTLRQRADEIAQKEEDKLDRIVEEGEEKAVTPGIIEENVGDAEADLLVAVREGVDDAAVDIKLHLRNRAMELEKQIMEQRLSKLRGRPVKLNIVDGDVEEEAGPQQPQVPQTPQQPMGYGQGAYGAPQYQQPQGGYQQNAPPQGYQQAPAGQYQYQQQQPQYQQPQYQQAPPQGYQQAPENGYQQAPQYQQPPQGGYQQPAPGGYAPPPGGMINTTSGIGAPPVDPNSMIGTTPASGYETADVGGDGVSEGEQPLGEESAVGPNAPEGTGGEGED